MRPGFAYAAVALLAVLYLPPWHGLLGMFPAHMLRHMGLVALVAPLLVLAWPALSQRWAPAVLAGAVLEFVVVWGWHLPAVHGWARGSLAVTVLEQAMFLAAGWAVWAGALTAQEPVAGAGGLFLTSIHMTMLGALLVLAPGDLYGGSDVAGQQIGGMLMLAVGTPVYILGGLVLTRRSLQGGVT